MTKVIAPSLPNALRDRPLRSTPEMIGIVWMGSVRRLSIFDVLTALPDRDGRRPRYDELIDRANVQDVHGITVHVAALDDVIASKEWADRPKDREALVELRELCP